MLSALCLFALADNAALSPAGPPPIALLFPIHFFAPNCPEPASRSLFPFFPAGVGEVEVEEGGGRLFVYFEGGRQDSRCFLGHVCCGS